MRAFVSKEDILRGREAHPGNRVHQRRVSFMLIRAFSFIGRMIDKAESKEESGR
jgi:hypothetical protein